MKRVGIVFLSLLVMLSQTWIGCAIGMAEATQAEGDVIHLEFINQKREAVSTFEAIIKAFEAENPGIKIELNSPPDGTTVLAGRAASNDLPDLWTDWPSQAHYKEYAKSGYILDLTDQPFFANVNDEILELCRLSDGRIYTAPISLNTYGVFYSISAFEEMNLQVPETYEEFITLLDTIKAAEKTPILFPDKDAWTIDQFFSFNSGVWTKDFMEVYTQCLNGESHIKDNQDVQTTAQRTLDLRVAYGQPDTLGTSYDDAINDFANGHSTMFIQGIWAAGSIQKANPDFAFSMFPIPADNAEDTRVMAGVDCAINVSATSENQDAALKFIEFMLTPENAQLYSELDRSPSAVINGSVDLGEISPLVEYLNSGKTFPQLLNINTAEIASNEPDLCQILIATQDVNSFLEELDALWFGAAQ